MKLHSAYYQLTCFGGWHLVDGYENEVTIIHAERRLWHSEKGSKEYPLSKITLYKNGTYSIIKGALSVYDREVLESLKFKLKK